ncbi:MAG: carboxypeptidase-like regulatory domain-containing protein [Bacteroidales bacterium]|nr:carboxypeptidase-like regulatory domain-containing protein [Bacteroidales bacterium]MCF8388400.1 carboxypeptidase-like regulatory domain-containing protein [Bacteroidales bacterium]MCF8398273.1 carboxypeptidase-like regulatory domain-containing protein [Bacteroidales bacterium]
MKKIQITSIIVFSFLQIALSQGSGSLEGIVFDNTRSEGVQYAHIHLLKSDLRMITDSAGNFKLEDIPAGDEVLKNDALGYGKPRIVHIRIFEDSTVFIRLNLEACEYDYLGGGNCPVCLQTDQVIPIVYGNPGRKTIRRMKKGEVYLGGTVIDYCQPRFYCKRDKVKF